MRFKVFGAALFAAGILGAPAAQAQTEIQWWHSMGGALGEKLNELATKFNASQKEYKVVPVYKGSYPESMTAAIAAFRAGNAPHLLQVFEVGTATMMAAKGAIVPVDQGDGGRRRSPSIPKAYLPTVAGYYTDPKGNMLSFPFNSSTVVFYINKDAFKKAGLDPEQAPKTWKEMIAAARQAQGRGPGMRLHHRLAVLDAHRELQRLAQRADRHQGERHGRHGHRVHHQFAAARAPHDDAGRHGEEGPVHLRRAHQPGRSQVRERRVRDAHVVSTGAQANIRQNAKFDWSVNFIPYHDDVKGAPQNSIIGGASLWVMGGKKPDDYKGVAKFFAFLSQARDPDGMAHRHRLRADHAWRPTR